MVQEKIPSLRLDCSHLFFFAKLLHAKPEHASGEACCREKRGRKPEKKKKETFFFSLREGGSLYTGYKSFLVSSGRILREKADCKQSSLRQKLIKSIP